MADRRDRMNKSRFSYRHSDDDIFDKETPFNEMEVFFIELAFSKLDEYAQSNWQEPEIKPYAQVLLNNIRDEIQKKLYKPTYSVRVTLFTTYFMENGWKDCELYVSLAFYLARILEGQKRIISEDNFHRKLSTFELVENTDCMEKTMTAY